MKISRSDLVHFVNLTSAADYNAERKEEYRKLGRKILTALAEVMGLKKGDFDIRWNAGGHAVSGDHILHTDWFYLALHDNLGAGWFYFRKCHGRNDYGTGTDCPNQIYIWPTFTAFGLEGLAKAIKKQCGVTELVSA